ncbi:MAG TPA: hypothetical protein VK196_12590 [Magnetospirillum sp.]|nr:hypothetical protein [Magnetospirillum sp.]
MPDLGPTELSTGVREIDADTESLCFLMGKIFDPLVECRRQHGECDRTQCARIAAILKFVDRSFARQDALMEAADYPLAADHRAEHEGLKEQLVAMQSAGICADRDRLVVREAVSQWLLRHNRSFDRLLANWAVTRRVLLPTP